MSGKNTKMEIMILAFIFGNGLVSQTNEVIKKLMLCENLLKIHKF